MMEFLGIRGNPVTHFSMILIVFHDSVNQGQSLAVEATNPSRVQRIIMVLWQHLEQCSTILQVQVLYVHCSNILYIVRVF